jgi:2,4-dienoyl-CoA reductase-like NADH-dependent reductase (Old Yellow Enzyme family)
MRSPAALIGAQPVGPSDDAETGARALDLAEVAQLEEDFIAAALRAERAGFDGVELHGAHGYVLAQFLSAETNRREDRYGGSPENRSRILCDILAGIRARCRTGFKVGVRLSPERFGLRLPEMVSLADRLMSGGMVDFLDLSLWDVFKEPMDAEFQGRSLLSYFTALDRGQVRVGAAGKITGAADVARCLEAGLDFAIVGRAAILHHDFPERVRADPGFRAAPLPVTPEHLLNEGLSPAFIGYMGNWKGFVAPAAGAAAPA